MVEDDFDDEGRAHVKIVRADKERSLRKPYVDRRDFYVPPLPEEEEADNKPLPFFAADSKARWDYHYEAEKRYFMRHFDSSLPGTKFIIDNLSPSDVSSFIVECRKDYPDIWKELRHLVPQKAGKPALNRSSEETADMCHHKLI
ncbi:hypothetical protein BUALT_Bualt04G0017800 [Buddleja alternifolia]|uniref:Uncharacterized protein n=1 Tax=Buddleja alternifolia TaxID=168488 RepID=A0AAV6XKH1_9LAMI|nr:hypothetical protein BUALT_Bualt04G0017800 [Buddleja alternifolia]